MEETFNNKDDSHIQVLREKAKENRKRSPEIGANVISQAFFSWVSSLFFLARKKRRKDGSEIEDSDLWDLPAWDHTATLSDRFDDSWRRSAAKKLGMSPQDRNVDEFASTDQLTSQEASSILTWSVWGVVRSRMILAGFVKLCNSSVQFLYPILINLILEYIQDLNTPQEQNIWVGYTFAAALGLAMITKSLLENMYFWLVWRSGWQVRSILTTEVYRKSLRLSASARQTMTVGQIVNLMQLDTTKLEAFMVQAFHVMWDALYQIAGYMVLLYIYIDWSAFVGLGVMVMAIPIQMFVFGRVLALNKKMVKVTDNRVKLTNEILQGMLGIKMAAWEENYTEVINEFRKKEVKYLRLTMYLTSFSSAYMMALPAITAVAAIASYAVNVDGAIDAATLFTALNIFGQLRFALMFFPQALQAYVQARVSRKRIADFLALEEVVQDRSRDLQDAQHGPIVQIQDGTFYWKRPSHLVAEKRKSKSLNTEGAGDGISIEVVENPQNVVWPGDEDLENPDQVVAERPALEKINLNVEKGHLVGIIGSVGSGKSSLIGAILNELHRSSGHVAVSGTIAYAAQNAWIFNASVRENILYGEEYDPDRYEKVLEACQLLHDLEVLQDGDQTIIGERGINLSGGQKQRISVARAAYSKKEIVILDDPLSALDPEVARQMFEKCILGFLKKRTRILVTNQLNFLPRCNEVVVMDAEPHQPGTIVEQGRYSLLIRSGLDFSKLMEKFQGAGGEAKAENRAESEISASASEARKSSVMSGATPSPTESKQNAAVREKAGQELMQVEERAKGAVHLSEYVGYIKAGGGFLFFGFVLFMFVVSMLGMILNTAWISIWSSDAQYENNSLNFYLIGYALTAILLALLTYARSLALFFLALRASIKMHQKLIDSITHAPMRFFDTTPIGRIISRFSKDLFLADTQLPMFYSFFLFTTIFMIFSFGTIGFTTPLFLVSLPFLGVIYLYILNYYRPVARDVKRLEAISRSPVYAHFSETLGGLSTIRAFDFVDKFSAQNALKVDENLKGWYHVKCIERWLSIRLEIIGATITVIAASLAVFSSEEGLINAGLAGLSLTFAISITGLLNQTVRSFAELEAGMNSVERILYYGNQIEQEAAFESKSPPHTDWPSRGLIEIENLEARYRPETPLVLKGINLRIEAGFRVGVVGRTGSGKSTTLLILLRLIEPERGRIFIDGVDISSIGLHELRSKVSIVPQSPVIFSGTVRSNLDPFHKYIDEEIWDALEQCALNVTIHELGGLDAEVSEYGENFSQGQRQLLCLARSVLAQAKILLLDEATSSIDYATDTAIQETIRNSFADATIITIAHRINTVITNDRILVLSDGHVKEYDTPENLLSNPRSEFTGMVNELGPDLAAQLRRQAQK